MGLRRSVREVRDVRELRERVRCMIGFRKKSLPAMAPAGAPCMEMLSVAALAARRALATWECHCDVAGSTENVAVAGSDTCKKSSDLGCAVAEGASRTRRK